MNEPNDLDIVFAFMKFFVLIVLAAAVIGFIAYIAAQLLLIPLQVIYGGLGAVGLISFFI